MGSSAVPRRYDVGRGDGQRLVGRAPPRLSMASSPNRETYIGTDLNRWPSATSAIFGI